MQSLIIFYISRWLYIDRVLLRFVEFLGLIGNKNKDEFEKLDEHLEHEHSMQRFIGEIWPSRTYKNAF